MQIRPAVLNKDVLGQAEVLIALRMTSPRDVAAIDEWIRLHADTDQATELRRSLPSLPIGTAWIWSPGWLERLDRVMIRPRNTFDSSATPKPGAVARRPRLATVDVARLRDQMAASPGPTPAAATGQTVARIRELEATIRDLRSRPVQVREVPVLDAAARAQLDELGQQLDALVGTVQQLRSVITAALESTSSGTAAAPPPDSPVTRPQPAYAAKGAPSALISSAAAPKSQVNGAPLRAGARRMLEALGSHHPARLSRAQLATLARMKPTSGTFSTYLSNLRGAGYLEEQDGLLQLTADGRNALGAGPAFSPLTADQVRDQWRQAMRAGARRMLDILIEVYPAAMSRADLAGAAGLEPTSGTFSTYLSNLRRNGLVQETGEGLTASAILFQNPGTIA